MTEQEIADLKKENEDLKFLFWDYFKIAQLYMLRGEDLKQWNAFLYGSGTKPPFTEGSQSMKVVKLCGKLPA